MAKILTSVVSSIIMILMYLKLKRTLTCLLSGLQCVLFRILGFMQYSIQPVIHPNLSQKYFYILRYIIITMTVAKLNALSSIILI